MSDKDLYNLCKKYGARALAARRKFLGLLPEVNRRELASHRAGGSWLARRGFSSIFEFAAKLAGVSEEQVRRVLNLERKFADKPDLHQLLVGGEASVNKLVHIASIATRENQEELAEKVKILPARALETLVRDEKRAGEPVTCGQTDSLFKSIKGSPGGLVEPPDQHKSVHVNTQISSIDVVVKLAGVFSDELKNKLLEMADKGLNVNAILLDLLKRRELEIAQEKERLAREINGHAKGSCGEACDLEKGALDGSGEANGSCGEANGSCGEANGSCGEAGGKNVMVPSRYISVKIKRVLAAEYGKKCAVPACGRQAEIIHHTARFALTGAHDPHYLAPLCKEHHELAHVIDAKFVRKRWRGE